MTVVALAVPDGAALLELSAPCAVFGRPRLDILDPWYDFRVCSGGGAVVDGFLTVGAPYGLDELALADTVIVPPAGHYTDTPRDLVDAVRAAHASGARIASICTGAFVLAEAGLLDGRRATTHWFHAAQLAARYPEVDVDPGVLYIDHGDVLTSAGSAAGLDLCLHLVRREHGATVANAIARRLVVAPHRDGGQAQFIEHPVTEPTGYDLAGLLEWALVRLHEPLTVADLARQAHMSTRNLGRQFRAVTGTTPLQWLLTQRVHLAQELLEGTDDSLDLIADKSGLGSAATLRRHFRRVLGVAPQAYRRSFRAPARPAARDIA